MNNLEIAKMLTISTSNVPRDDILLLESGDDSIVSYELDEYGFLIYANEQICNELDLSKFSQAFRDALRLAQDNDCDYLRLDRDANEVDGLQVFDW